MLILVFVYLFQNIKVDELILTRNTERINYTKILYTPTYVTFVQPTVLKTAGVYKVYLL